MSTKVYGTSDDLIELEGDVRGEVGYYGSGPEEPGTLFFSDGTVLDVWYGKKDHEGVWAVNPRRAGPLFDRVDVCTDEDATPYSDVAHFRPGLTWAYFSKGAEQVR